MIDAADRRVLGMILIAALLVTVLVLGGAVLLGAAVAIYHGIAG